MESNSRRKRTHLSSTQVSLLDASFKANSHPDSSTRSHLAQELGVSERTVQIWFQNRRAKQKKVHVRLTQPKAGLHPPFRSFMTPQVLEPQFRNRPRSISKPEPKSFQLISDIEALQGQQRALSEGLSITQFSSLGSLNQAPMEIIPLQVNVLRIGTWTRFSSEPGLEWDLSCSFILSERAFNWKVRIGEYQFKMVVGFDHIQYIRLQPTGQLDIHLSPSLSFGMLRMGQDNDWVPCGDFTEDEQASVESVHSLEGDYETLKYALLDMVILAPELSQKMNPGLDREYSLSPSATPEPFMMQYTHESLKTRESTSVESHLMLQAPFFYSTVSPSDIELPYNSLYEPF